MQILQPNKVISDRTKDRPNSPVVRVLDYDFKERTPYEILVMERAAGVPALQDLHQMSLEQVTSLFRQVIVEIRNICEQVTFDSYGDLNDDGGMRGTVGDFSTCSAFLLNGLENSVRKIREAGTLEEEDLQKLEAHVKKYVHVFDINEQRPVFANADTVWGNVLHEGDRLTALIDFDWSVRGPPSFWLPSLLCGIYHPASGMMPSEMELFPHLRGLRLPSLLSILRTELPNVMSDPHLVRKLNVYSVTIQLQFIASSPELAAGIKPFVRQTILRELAETEDELLDTMYGRILLKEW